MIDVGHENGYVDTQMRIFVYDLAKSFFAQEPDDDRCSLWKSIFSAFSMVRDQPALCAASGKMVEVLDNQGGKGIRKEYNALFVDPYSESRLNRTLSYYADGKSLGPALAMVREFMKKAGIERRDDCREPEDSIEVLMDGMIVLLEESREKDGEYGMDFERCLFLDFIRPLTEAMIRRMDGMDDFPFYQACAAYLKEWLKIERSFVV